MTVYEVACKTKAYLSDVGAVSTLRFHENGALFGTSWLWTPPLHCPPRAPGSSLSWGASRATPQRQHLTGQTFGVEDCSSSIHPWGLRTTHCASPLGMLRRTQHGPCLCVIRDTWHLCLGWGRRKPQLSWSSVAWPQRSVCPLLPAFGCLAPVVMVLPGLLTNRVLLASLCLRCLATVPAQNPLSSIHPWVLIFIFQNMFTLSIL